MNGKKAGSRNAERLQSSKITHANIEPYEVQAHHLLCAVCVRGGCQTPLAPKDRLDALLELIWKYPYLALKITADVDITRNHYLNLYAHAGKQAADASEIPPTDHVARRKDLQVVRYLGIAPNTVLPAYLAYSILFDRLPSLMGICRTDSKPSESWPECPHARSGYYERIARFPKVKAAEEAKKGEELDGKGLWAIIRPRTREDVAEAKQASARNILEEAKRLYIRPAHLLCILCTARHQEPLPQDNLVELRQRMETDPDIPVTLVEGCCMVCDPCSIYHAGENLCYRAHIKNSLRDLIMFEKLGLKPGDTMPAQSLYGLVYERIEHLQEVCSWGDGLNTAPFWSPCGDDLTKPDKRYQALRESGFLATPPSGACGAP